MPIWTYESCAHDSGPYAEVTRCPFCQTTLTSLSHEREGGSIDNDSGARLECCVCQTCGWWRAIRETRIWGAVHDGCARLAFQKYCSAGSLIELDLDDLSLPLEEVSAYLCAKFDSRFTMSPRLFEMTVASVFAQFNWEAFLTGYSNDGGIDTILTNGPNRVGVQVKRYRGKIAARQIREFIGALGLAGIPRGFFVTTSDYQPGALLCGQTP